MAVDIERPAALGDREQQAGWLTAGCFEAMVKDLRTVLRLLAEQGRTHCRHHRLRSTPESGERAGYDHAKRKKGFKIHMAADAPGHLLTLHITPATAGHGIALDVVKLSEANEVSCSCRGAGW